MSLLTPERVPVKVYRWDDDGAPALDKTPNCIATIFKACLVTGYGTKEGAGWTLAFEDLATNTKVFNVKSDTSPPLYLRCYNDTGEAMGVQLAKDAVDANTVTSVAECPTIFKYLGSFTTGEWMVIASDRGFWFFAQVNTNNRPIDRSGVFLFAGIIPGLTNDAFIIKHTGGTWGGTDDDRYGIMPSRSGSESAAAAAAVYITTKDKMTHITALNSVFNGQSEITDMTITSRVYIIFDKNIYMLPISIPSRNDLTNFTLVTNDIINFCTATHYNYDNVYISTDYWEY